MPTADPLPPLKVNRAPVLTLWAAVVAERLGHSRGAALTLGRAEVGASAQATRLSPIATSVTRAGAPKRSARAVAPAITSEAA